jgi:type IV pilus assembly protein PilN
VIEELQANRTEMVHLFNELAKRMPEGIYLRTLVQTQQKIVLTGVAQSNARITTLMNSLDESPLLENSTLIETKAEVIANRRLNAFSVHTFITRQLEDSDKPLRKDKK